MERLERISTFLFSLPTQLYSIVSLSIYLIWLQTLSFLSGHCYTLLISVEKQTEKRFQMVFISRQVYLPRFHFVCDAMSSGMEHFALKCDKTNYVCLLKPTMSAFWNQLCLPFETNYVGLLKPTMSAFWNQLCLPFKTNYVCLLKPTISAFCMYKFNTWSEHMIWPACSFLAIMVSVLAVPMTRGRACLRGARTDAWSRSRSQSWSQSRSRSRSWSRSRSGYRHLMVMHVEVWIQTYG